MLNRWQAGLASWLVLAALLGFGAAYANPAAPLHVTDLRRDGAQAAQANLPILLFFTQTHCPYCHRARRDFLGPMSRNTDYATRVLIREVDVERKGLPVAFGGERLTPATLATRYGVRVYPTVVMVSPVGKLLGKPIEGLLTADFYGYYLDEAISQAQQTLAAAPPDPSTQPASPPATQAKP
jgi:thioredoxin-related protein